MSLEFDAFVSYSRADTDEVQYLVRYLEDDYNLKVWIDSKLKPGDFFVGEIEKAIDASAGAIVCIKQEPDGFQAREIDAIISKMTTDKSFKVYPVHLPASNPGKLKGVKLLNTIHYVDLRGGLSDLAKLRRLADSLRQNKLVPVYKLAGSTAAYPQYDLPGGYRADVEKITALLIGNSLYSYRDVAIRELVQNAYDACARRRRAGLQYNPQIEFSINTKEHWFQITDTGEGMSPSHITNQFAVIGKSISHEEDIIDRSLDGGEEERLFLIAKFGIGFISTFIISNAVAVSTQHEGYDQINFNITDVTNAFEYTAGSVIGRQPGLIGTSIRVYLREHYRTGGSQVLDVAAAIKKYCRHVPYLALTIDGKKETLGGEWNLEAGAPIFERTIPRLYQAKLAFAGSRTAGVICSNQGFYIETNSEQLLPSKVPACLSGEINFFLV